MLRVPNLVQSDLVFNERLTEFSVDIYIKRDYIIFGVIWFILTNLFDLVAYIKDGGGFADLLQSYNILTGNTWLIVVLTALFAPIVVMRIKAVKNRSFET